MTNFYTELEDNIKLKIDNNDFIKALSLIDEELSMPYIPMNLEKKLIAYKNKILSTINSENSKMDIFNIFEALRLNFKLIDKYELSNNLNKYNLNEYLPEIKELLLLPTKDINMSTKRNIVNILIKQNIDVKLKVLTDDGEIQVETNELTSLMENNEFVSLTKEIEEKLFKNPVLLNLSLNLLEQYYLLFMFEAYKVDLMLPSLSIPLCTSKILNDDKAYEEIIKDVDEIQFKAIEEDIEKIFSKRL